MSDLKKTFQDMDKTEVGEYRHGRGHFPTEDDGGRANVEVLQALCPNPGATALESVVWAADQIESLQRKNERFRESIEKAGVEVFEQIDHKAPTHWLLARIVSRAKQPSITPEMREKLNECIAGYRISGTDGNRKYWAVELISVVSDLLGEQG